MAVFERQKWRSVGCDNPAEDDVHFVVEVLPRRRPSFACVYGYQDEIHLVVEILPKKVLFCMC